MAAMSRGQREKRAFKVVKKSKKTQSSNKHRFESFSNRIEKLTIDPIRRSTSERDIAPAGLGSSTSYFRNALEEWQDKNLTEHFSNFVRDVDCISESLPQLLYHHENIADQLFKYIEAGPQLSLEPLLDLLTQFARDLGSRFEAHFPRCVKVLSKVSSKSENIEVVEWSLNSIVWVFKYLSRILVLDLRPTYDLMAPLLGKPGGERIKPFVARFSAEAFSFLLRKAATTYRRDEKPLRKILEHILKDVRESSESEIFQNGVMTLFSQSIRGPQKVLHPAGLPILDEMLRVGLDVNHGSRNPQQRHVLYGVVIALAHHCDEESFVSVVETILDATSFERVDVDLEMSIRFLLEISAIRKGARVARWSVLFQRLEECFGMVQKHTPHRKSLVSDVLGTAAVMFQFSPLEESLPFLRLLDDATEEPWRSHFVSFCAFFLQLGTERFHNMVVPSLRKFCSSNQQDSPAELILLLRRAQENGLMGADCPLQSLDSQGWEAGLAKKLEDLPRELSAELPNEDLLYQLSCELDICSNLRLSHASQRRLSPLIFDSINVGFGMEHEDTERFWRFRWGNLFKALCHMSAEDSMIGTVARIACSHAGRFVGVLPYWEAVQACLSNSDAASLRLEENDKKRLTEGALSCLTLPSHQIRLLGLQTFISLYKASNRDVPAIWELALTIEQSPFDMQSQRTISAQICKMGTAYKHFKSDPWIRQAIPRYCFGLLHVHLASVWEDSCKAFIAICEEKEGQDAVLQVASVWLQGSEEHYSELQERKANDSPEHRCFYSDFECFNLAKVDKLYQESLEETEDAQERLRALFESTHKQVPQVSSFCRAQALRVLQVVPQVAEKKSRILVPLFLDWANNNSSGIPPKEDGDPGDGHCSRQRWNRKDQKSMVSLLASFINPRVLYKSEQVYDALLQLVSNGDVELQKPALKALLTWKEAALEQYKEDLFKMLDDERFREQLAVFLDVGDEDSIIQEQHQEKLMTVVLRILYGRIISKTGSGIKGGGLESRRKASFVALTRFEKKYMQQFLDIILGPLNNIQLVAGDGRLRDDVLGTSILALRKQLGLLNMLLDMVTTLGSSFVSMAERLVQPLLYCLLRTRAQEENAEPEDVDSLTKSVRQTSLRTLTAMFQLYPALNWNSYIPVLFTRFINSMLDRLPLETAHSISGVLKLFDAWSTSPETAIFLSGYNDEVLPRIAQCLTIATAKEEVKTFVLKLLSNLVGHAQHDKDVAKMLESHGDGLLQATEALLRGHVSKDLLDQSIATVTGLAPYIPNHKCIGLIEICGFLLQQQTKRVAPRVKSQILHLLLPLLSDLKLKQVVDSNDDRNILGQSFADTFSRRGISEVEISLPEFRKVALKSYFTLAEQFSFFQDRDSREALSQVFAKLVQHSQRLRKISALCIALNAFSEERLDEPDFERRSDAFESIRDQNARWDVLAWTPVVQNLVFFIRDDEDGIRANAALGLRRFVERAAATNPVDSDLRSLLSVTLLPAVQRGIQKNSSELVRTEYLSVLSHIIKHMPDLDSVSDMRILLVGDDEEASFFTNILHIQQHRRLRALRRLSKACQAGKLSSTNITQFFIPLMETFVFEQGQSENAHSLSAETVTTIGEVSQWIDWSQYRALLKKYAGYIETKPDLEKVVMKLLSVMVDCLSRAKEERDARSMDEQADNTEPRIMSKLSKTMPQEESLAVELTKNILPYLSAYLHDKDEATVSRRVPVALTVVKLLQIIPQELSTRLPPTLMDLCGILKSRMHESRELTRRTLADIAALIGPPYFSFILKELRRALQRGYQLHVLSFTMHSILVSTSVSFTQGDLDYCINDCISVIMDDIFGVTGQEKDAEDYISKMKEVKSSKSFDSMEIIASITTLPYFVDLIRPVQRLLHERLDDRVLRKIDELLRRLRLGLVRNEAAKSRDLLVFCYELWTDTYKTPLNKELAAAQDWKTKRYLVKMKPDNKSLSRALTTSQSARLVRFSIDVLRDVVPKHEALQKPSILAGFLKLIGDAIVAGDDEVKTAAFRLAASIIRVVKAPFPQLDEDAVVYAREAMRAVRDAHSTQTELAQAALKVATEILAKRRNASIRDGDVAFLLKALKGDIEEPARQGVAFSFLKAVVACKVIIPEVYEIMDSVAAIMVTNQARETRQLARSAYFAFLMDYPQAKKRLDKQISFLVKNLGYEHVEGRQSVMESLHLLLTKIGGDLVGEIQNTVFLPLVLTMVNDESSECRSFAQLLLKDIFMCADQEKMKGFLKLMLNWIQQQENETLRRAGLQCWTLNLEMKAADTRQSAPFILAVEDILTSANKNGEETDGELVYFALKALETCLNSFASDSDPGSLPVMPSRKKLMQLILEFQFHPRLWVKQAAAQIVGVYFADFARGAQSSTGVRELANIPLATGSGGLTLDGQDMLKITKANLRFFRIPHVSEELVGQAVKNLAFLGNCFAANKLTWQFGSSRDEIEEDEEAAADSADEDVPEERFAVQYLVHRLSEIIRRETETTKAPALVPKVAALKLLDALRSRLVTPPFQTTCIPPLLRALHNLTDSSMAHPSSADPAFTSAYKQLQETAQDMMRKTQDALGTETYLKEMAKVKKDAIERREYRRAKRRVEAVTAPERYEAKKRRKREGGREKRKEKNAELRGKRRGW